MLSTEEAQQQVDALAMQLNADGVSALAAYEGLQALRTQVEIGILRADDPELLAADQRFVKLRMVAAETRQALELAQQALAQAQRPRRTPEKLLAQRWGEATQDGDWLRWKRDSEALQGLQEGMPGFDRYVASVRQQIGKLLMAWHRAGRPVVEVSDESATGA